MTRYAGCTHLTYFLAVATLTLIYLVIVFNSKGEEEFVAIYGSTIGGLRVQHLGVGVVTG